MPAHGGKLVLLFDVTFLIPFYFLLPKVYVGLRQTEVFAILMTMPETAVHKDDRAVLRNTKSGWPGRRGWFSR